MNTSELTGDALDCLVAKIEGNSRGYFSPSTNWAHGGPIIDKLIKGHLFLMEDGDGDGEYACHVAYSRTPHDNSHGFGKTPLIAAMRCYVASELGNDVEVPTELLKDGQDIGIDKDGNIICWDATKQEPYNSGEEYLGEL